MANLPNTVYLKRGPNDGDGLIATEHSGVAYVPKVAQATIEAPERLWAWHWHKDWDANAPLSGPDAIAQFGYCRPTNRRPLDRREGESGAEYVRKDLYDAAIARAELAEARAKAALECVAIEATARAMAKTQVAALTARVGELEGVLQAAGYMRDAADRVSEWFCNHADHLEGARIQALRFCMVAYDTARAALSKEAGE